MIIGRFKVQCHPEWTDRVAEAIAAVEGPSRLIPGVIHFDCSRSLTDPNSFIATEVFADRAAFDQQNAQAEVAHFLSLLSAGGATGDYEWTTWEAPAAQ